MNLFTLQQMADRGEKIAALTSYDASFATLCENAGVEILLVGDSLGMVLQGGNNTLAVTLHDMQYHTRCVAKGSKSAYIIADMPFGSYQQSPEQALRNATRLMAAGAHMIKLEGGDVMLKTVEFLVKRGIPVCTHLGFTPQSVNQLGGYRVQGRSEDDAAQIMTDALAMSEAGVSFVLLEMVPAALAKAITVSIKVPTIGIGAGNDCSGQVLVLQDLLGIYTGVAAKAPSDFKSPRFVRNFLKDSAMNGNPSIQGAVETYVAAVKDKSFPGLEHSY